MTKKRVAVIGAGPSGTAQLRAFASAEKKGADIPEIVCFEKQDDWGGMWNYTWRTGSDQFGEPVHGSMYRYLWSNGPKECLEFADYSFEEHFGRPIPSYPPREVLVDYIKGRVEKSGVRKWVRFGSVVRNLTWSEATKKFTVTVKDLKEDRVYSEEFDDVVVASGHFSTPNVPYFEGLDKFLGRVMHSHDFRAADEFAGKDIVVVGGSYSAEDIATQCHKYGCKSVTITYRTKPMGFAWPESFSERPLLQKVVGRTAYFKDGSSKDVDAIILCTGYLHHFPFIDDSLRLKTRNRLFPSGLYKGVAWSANAHLFYVGMQDQYYTFNMFDVQAWWARDVILGRIVIPEQVRMEQDMAKWTTTEEGVKNAFEAIDFQTLYVKDLASVTDYPAFKWDQVAELFKLWEHHKVEGILTYRDRSYKSVLTGNQAPPLVVTWMKAMDDSMAWFLSKH